MQSVNPRPSQPAPVYQEDAIRDLIRTTALRAGPLLRSYLSQPDKRTHTRQVIRSIAARLGEHARALRTPAVGGAGGHLAPDAELATLDEAQKAVMMFNALLSLIDAHEELERRRSEAQRALVDAQKVRSDLQKSIVHGKQLDESLRKEKQKVTDLEERLKSEESRSRTFEEQLKAMDERMQTDSIDRGEHLSKIRAVEREWKQKLADASEGGKETEFLRREVELAESRKTAAEERAERMRVEREALASETARLKADASRLQLEHHSSETAREMLQERAGETASHLAEARAAAQTAETMLRERTNEVERLRSQGDSFAEDMARRRFQPKIDDLETELAKTRAELREARDRLMKVERNLSDEQRKAATLQSLVSDEHLKGRPEQAKTGLLTQAHDRKRLKRDD